MAVEEAEISAEIEDQLDGPRWKEFLNEISQRIAENFVKNTIEI